MLQSIAPCAIDAFPRSADRGLIEAAMRSAEALTDRRRQFRDQLIAASLKPDLAPSRDDLAAEFRDQLIAASLKRLSNVLRRNAAHRISAIS